MALLDENELSDVTGGAATGGPLFSYTVRAKDTLSKVALRFGTTPAVLARINELNSADIKPGTVLLIPQN